MALSNDQKALLRLLAQREEGYDDIAALMGLSVGEVRERVKGALRELDAAGAGAAAPEPKAPEPTRAAPIPEAAAAADPPQPRPAPADPSPRVDPSPPKPRRAKQRPRPTLPRSRRRLAELGGGALVALLLILFATGAIDIGGGDSDSDDGTPSAGTNIAANSDKLTQATLEPVDGGEESGRALFGRLGKKVVLQVIADGLEPTAAGETYTVWLYGSPKLALRIGAVRVGKPGRLGARFEVPAEVLALVANGAFTKIDISRTSESAYKAEVVRAKRQERLPRYTGESVLRGDIVGPLAEGAPEGG